MDVLVRVVINYPIPVGFDRNPGASGCPTGLNQRCVAEREWLAWIGRTVLKAVTCGLLPCPKMATGKWR